MYDPLVVDTFVNRLEELERSARDLGPVNPTLVQIAELNSPPQLSELPETPDSVLTVKSALRAEDVAPMALGLAGLSHLSGCVFFVGNTKSTSLVAASVAGAMPTAFLGTTAEIGDRVVGWSASTGSAVRNAVVELEFGAQPPFKGAARCSAFPARTADGTAAVLLFVTGDDGLTEHDEERMRILTRDLVMAMTDTGGAGAPARPSADAALLSQFLPSDAKTAAACFPIGVVAVKFVQDAHHFETAVRSAVRATDSLVSLENGTFVLLLQRASEASVLRIIDRLKSECDVDGTSRPQFEWTVLNELTERVEGEFSAVLQTLGRGFAGPVSTKLH